MISYFIKTDFWGYSRKLRLKVLGVNLVGIGIGGGVGWVGDRIFGTEPIGMVIGVLVSFPVVMKVLVDRVLAVKK